MPVVKRGDHAVRRVASSRRGAENDRATPRHYVVFRATTRPDGSTREQYEVPELPAPVDRAGFVAWLDTSLPSTKDHALLSCLVIRELVDVHGSLLTCTIERRRGSPTGRYQGEPARITFAGAGDQVRLYRATSAGQLQEIVPTLDQRLSPAMRRDHFVGEAATIRQVFGEATQVLDARSPTLMEELIGLSSVLHIRAASGMEIDCGLGWHGTTPYLLRADFPRFGAPPALPAATAAAIAVAAVTAGMTTFESRTDARGPAVLARSDRDGTLHLIRPDGTDTRFDPYLPGVPDALLNPDQKTWVRYAEAHEQLAVLDAYPDGPADGVFVLAADPAARVTRHLIDADGVEVWRAQAGDTLAAHLYREGLIGPRET